LARRSNQPPIIGMRPVRFEPRKSTDKSFLVLFFKKELLAFLHAASINIVIQLRVMAALS
jgi:hypothetical protein